jgi:hypothetical protein
VTTDKEASVKTILIIYPHWPPSNLAGVHRPRLIANYLQEFSWHPIILTVSSAYYEETLDIEIGRTVSDKIEVIYTKAYQVTHPRVIGDIGIRAFPFLYKVALNLIRTRKIDFVWIPIPSFYTSLLGRLLHEKTAIPYGIDYIDPWVRDLGYRKDVRSQFSLQLAKWLEPLAVKKASLISGVSEAYYLPVIERNFKNKPIAHVGMPYGFDPRDHNVIINSLNIPWASVRECQPFVYAGAFLPNAHLFIKALFKVISQKREQGQWDIRRHLYFIGTGYYTGTSITDYARKFGIDSFVHEFRDRFPYLHVLNFLSLSFVVMAIGSTEQHYTASKIFQSLLSKKPVFALFHKDSSAVSILETCDAANYLVKYNPGDSSEKLESAIDEKLDQLLKIEKQWQPNLSKLNKFSARASAKALVDKLNNIVG